MKASVFSRPQGAKVRIDAPGLDAGAAAVAQVVGEQALRRRGVVDGLRDEVAATFDAFGEQARGLAAALVVALGDDHAADGEAAGMAGGEADRARQRQRDSARRRSGRPTIERKLQPVRVRGLVQPGAPAAPRRACPSALYTMAGRPLRSLQQRGVAARVDGADEWERPRRAACVRSRPGCRRPPRRRAAAPARRAASLSAAARDLSGAVPSARRGRAVEQDLSAPGQEALRFRSIDVRLERGEHRAVHRRVEAGLARSCAPPRRTARAPRACRRPRGRAAATRASRQAASRRTRGGSSTKSSASATPRARAEAPGFAHRLLEQPAQVRIGAHHAERRARHRGGAATGRRGTRTSPS